MNDRTDDVIYNDIPYKDTKQYGYANKFDYKKFYSQCYDLYHRKNHVYISEYNMPNDMFNSIWEKEVTNSLNTTKTYKPVEKLFVVNPNFHVTAKIHTNEKN